MANENKNNSSWRVYLFVFFSVVLIALSLWVVWDDEFGLRPWKKYQEEFKILKHDQLEKDYRKAVVEFQRSGGHARLANLEAQLAKAESAFQGKTNQEKYIQLTSQFDAVHEQVVLNQKELQNARGLFLESEYYFTKTQKQEYKVKMDELQRQIDAIASRGTLLQKKEDGLKSSLSELNSGKARIPGFRWRSSRFTSRISTKLIAARPAISVLTVKGRSRLCSRLLGILQALFTLIIMTRRSSDVPSVIVDRAGLPPQSKRRMER